MMKSVLVLEDGTQFEGQAIGRPGTVAGEVVFSTSMTGYQEMLSDPSYAGQLLTLTYPLIGNYGITEDDFESRAVQVSGFIIKQLCRAPSNWRSGGDLQTLLEQQGVVGIAGIDTRALTRRLRAAGVMMGIVTSEHEPAEALERLRAAPHYAEVDYVRRVSAPVPYVWEPAAGAGGARPLEVALIDCGVKYNILRSLANEGVRTTVFPCTTTSEEILERRPDGIAFSPGPGDPKHLGGIVDTAKKLIYSGKPVFGICLGNQIVGKAFGAETFKLPFGHRGGNHPVKDLDTGRVYITSQNHGYAVDPAGLEKSGLQVTHVNLNDGTVEGLRHRELPVFTIQYHPEANPGPRDSHYLFDRFVNAMTGEGGTEEG
jgi:carbamoyl-phosphate synthase small subunit